MLKVIINQLHGVNLQSDLEILIGLNININDSKMVSVGIRQMKDGKDPSSKNYAELTKQAFKFDNPTMDSKSEKPVESLLTFIRLKVKEEIEAMKLPHIVKVEII